MTLRTYRFACSSVTVMPHRNCEIRQHGQTINITDSKWGSNLRWACVFGVVGYKEPLSFNFSEILPMTCNR